MFLSKQNLDLNELENNELLNSAVKNATHRKKLTSDQYNNVSELCSEEARLVIGGLCYSEMFVTCGMYCELL